MEFKNWLFVVLAVPMRHPRVLGWLLVALLAALPASQSRVVRETLCVSSSSNPGLVLPLPPDPSVTSPPSQ